jgi:hypothetical protein
VAVTAFYLAMFALPAAILAAALFASGLMHRPSGH